MKDAIQKVRSYRSACLNHLDHLRSRMLKSDRVVFNGALGVVEELQKEIRQQDARLTLLDNYVTMFLEKIDADV